MEAQSTKQAKYPPTLSDIPQGFTLTNVDNGQKILVPTAMLPHLHGAFEAYRTKVEKKVANVKSRGFQVDDIIQATVAGGLFDFPANPLMDDQEKLVLHAEVIALQRQLGISYKDASHRLYMAEVEKLKLVDKEAKAWANVSASIAESLNRISKDLKMPEGQIVGQDTTHNECEVDTHGDTPDEKMDTD